MGKWFGNEKSGISHFLVLFGIPAHDVLPAESTQWIRNKSRFGLVTGSSERCKHRDVITADIESGKVCRIFEVSRMSRFARAHLTRAWQVVSAKQGDSFIQLYTC